MGGTYHERLIGEDMGEDTGVAVSGVYRLYPYITRSYILFAISAYCDMDDNTGVKSSGVYRLYLTLALLHLKLDHYDKTTYK